MGSKYFWSFIILSFSISKNLEDRNTFQKHFWWQKNSSPLNEKGCQNRPFFKPTLITILKAYGHTMAKSPILCSPNSNPNSQNAPTFICPNCLPKPKSLGFRWKKASLGVSSNYRAPMAKICSGVPTPTTTFWWINNNKYHTRVIISRIVRSERYDF